MQVIDSLQMENEVSARCDITELELPLCLLDLLQSIIDQYLVLFLQVSEDLHIELVCGFLNLDLGQGRCGYLPLHFFEFDITRDLIKSRLRINDPTRRKNDETCLSGAESVLLQQVCMELIAIVDLNFNVLLEELLPIQGHLSLNDMCGREVGVRILADEGHFLLWILQITIFSIESKLESMLLLWCDPRTEGLDILVRVALDLIV